MAMVVLGRTQLAAIVRDKTTRPQRQQGESNSRTQVSIRMLHLREAHEGLESIADRMPTMPTVAEKPAEGFLSTSCLKRGQPRIRGESVGRGGRGGRGERATESNGTVRFVKSLLWTLPVPTALQFLAGESSTSPNISIASVSERDSREHLRSILMLCPFGHSRTNR